MEIEPYSASGLDEPYRPMLAEIEYRNAMLSYEVASRPIIEKMVNLKSLYQSIRMYVNPDGTVTNATEHVWNDKEAHALYLQYEEYLRLLRCHIFGRNDDGSRKSE